MNYQEVLSFWFGSLNKGLPDEEHQTLWFRGSANDDADIKKQFATVLPAAIAGELDEWKETPQGRLALIILLDQFPRNIFRGSALAFAYDAAALNAAKEGIAQGQDKKLQTVARQFFYMPFQHSEVLEDQEQSMVLYQSMVDDAPTAELKSMAESCLSYAKQHHDLIKTFGRFPHRNKVMGRDSDAKEKHYLTNGGATFGQ